MSKNSISASGVFCSLIIMFTYKIYNTISSERGLASMERMTNVEFYFWPILLYLSV